MKRRILLLTLLTGLNFVALPFLFAPFFHRITEPTRQCLLERSGSECFSSEDFVDCEIRQAVLPIYGFKGFCRLPAVRVFAVLILLIPGWVLFKQPALQATLRRDALCSYLASVGIALGLWGLL